MNSRRKETWYRYFDGIDFEINLNHSKGMKDWYTYYITLRLDRIPENAHLWLVDKYMHSDLINKIDFHYGCTYYSKKYSQDGKVLGIKIGCDYNHLWDKEKLYSLETVTLDVKNSIRSFRQIVPNYKYWCSGNGKLYDQKDGVLGENGLSVMNTLIRIGVNITDMNSYAIEVLKREIGNLYGIKHENDYNPNKDGSLESEIEKRITELEHTVHILVKGQED